MLVVHPLAGQYLVYLVDGTKMPERITEISDRQSVVMDVSDFSKPVAVRSNSDISFAFNQSGSYLVLANNKSLTKRQREEFMNPDVKAKQYDVLVDASGKAMATTILSETETQVVCNAQGNKLTVPKAGLCFLIRRNGTHQVFMAPVQAQPVLLASQRFIQDLLTGSNLSASSLLSAGTDAAAPAAARTAKETKPGAGVDNPMNTEEFQRKGLDKIKEFTNYIQTITAVNYDRENANKAINMACDLFADQNSRVEVSVASGIENKKYKVRDYLTRLKLRSTQFDKVKVEYANLSYVSNFVKGTDGSYHGVVTFVQTFKGTVDGKIIYGDITKRTVEVVIRPYQKALNGESMLSWEVYLGDIGVVETKKI
ncbi:hypothetical protein LJ737_15195 [Hymenobacter sp. 15J16-1T3B]|uniref:hypothetical protein n=1 Tax=Hymenobacter sp. 15J16-1T3B TaxID=2886941 RepID=UPI001D114F03|nr:hypothetical protein [Hymenobacter sp. 15J16-1T3B]MCC3158594.1 hypothetical protein [Hymenobacter sp. 15J16-1T3B]